MDAFSRASRCFWLILGGYDVQFEGFGGDYVFWAGSAQSEGRRHMHLRIKSPPATAREGWSWALGRGRTVTVGRPSVVWLCGLDG